MDSSAEYGHIRPSPVGPLGVGGAQQAALRKAFGPVPPPYVTEAEALLDTGIQTMEVRRAVGVACAAFVPGKCCAYRMFPGR